MHSMRLSWSAAKELAELISSLGVTEFYHLAAITDVARCTDSMAECAEVNGTAAAVVVEAVRLAGGKARLLNASSAQIFGRNNAPLC